MTSGGFHVETAELKSHSSTVGQVASSVEEAATAAATERMGGLVYGVLLDVIALEPMNLWADHIHGLISDCQTVGERISEGLADNAEAYDTSETTTTTCVTQSGQEG